MTANRQLVEAQTRSVPTSAITPNPENPRLIFREVELRELEESIRKQGILVPLSVFKGADGYVLLDGERRWRCAKKIGLSRVPVIVQPEPTLMQNIMMMFAIHHAKTDWDPLPTALKLRRLEQIYEAEEGVKPNEAQLAQLASMSRGEVRRLKNILALPQEYLDELIVEAEKPRPQQALTVDHVLEATRGARALLKRDVINEEQASDLTRAIVSKFRNRVLRSTVEPRLLSRMARAVDREEVEPATVSRALRRVTDEPSYTVQAAFSDTVERVDREHKVELQVKRLVSDLNTFEGGPLLPDLRDALSELRRLLDRL